MQSIRFDSMIALPGGTFTTGSERFYSDEAPCRKVKVGAFRIDRTLVTNREFAAFVAVTGHVITAEFPPPAQFFMLPVVQCRVRAGDALFRSASPPLCRWSAA